MIQAALIFFSQDSIINLIGEFVNKLEVTFRAYFWRYEEIFQKDCNMVGWKKVRLILGKFDAVEHEKYANFILPSHPVEI